MTTDQYTPRGDYHSIRSAAASRITRYAREAEKMRSDPRQLGVHARVLQQGLDSHTTNDESVGSACVECGEPWPCNSIHLIFVPPENLE